jgi:hypothetical protein
MKRLLDDLRNAAENARPFDRLAILKAADELERVYFDRLIRTTEFRNPVEKSA